MPILKSIQEAEARIETLRIEAQDKVKKQMEDVIKQTEIKIQQLLSDSKKMNKKREEETAKTIISKEKEITEKYNNDFTNLSNKAEKRIGKAEDFIMKKVFQS